MKKNLIGFAIFALALLPLSAAADHLSGSFVSFGGGHIVVSGDHGQQHRFSHHRRLRIVDDHGAVLDRHALRRGHNVTVHYSDHNGHRRADRIVVHRRRHHSESGH